MRVMITGGAGFIGSNFIRYLLATEEQVTLLNLDSLTYAGNLHNLQEIEADERYAFARVDITDAKAVAQSIKEFRPEVAINFAAESHVDRSILDSSAFVRTNIMGTQVLLDASRKAGLRRFVQVSTDEVYGSLGPDDPAFTETTPIAPNSPYAASKAAADLLVASYVHTHDLDAVITRCSNNYGPYQFPEKFIPLFITNAMADRELPLYGDGLNVRDWIHVTDHCSGVWAATCRGRTGEVYNFGCANERTNIWIARKLLSILGKPESLIRLVRDRPGHDRRYAMGFAKSGRELGWSPRKDFTQGLEETVRWYQEHESWWQAIKSGEYRSYYQAQYGGR